MLLMKRTIWSSNNMCVYVVVLLLISSFASVNYGAPEGELPMAMQHHMHIDKAALIKTFEIDNSIIDCINIYQQPAFQHPLLVNHTLQSKPNYPGEVNDYINETSPPWNTSESCPKGSIPIERIQRNGHLRGDLSANHAYKHPHYPHKQGGLQQNGDTLVHEHSTIDVDHDKFYGLKATLNVWNPKVEGYGFSGSQVWIVAEEGQNAVEAGWTVEPNFYKSTETKFFTYWTADGYQRTGCSNLQCPGFIQTNPHTILGSKLQPVSVYGGEQYAINIEIFQDMKTKNWWLRLQGMDVGYWPKELFPLLLEGGDATAFGGEVSYRSGGPHSSTQMGSGHFAEEGFRKSSFIRNIQVLDTSRVYRNPRIYGPLEEAKNCYDIRLGDNADGPWGKFLFYGGPGRSDKCT